MLLTPAPRSAVRRRRAAFLLLATALAVGSLVVLPTAMAGPASGPGFVTRTTAGALTPGTVPDGTCAARVTAVGGGGASSPVTAGFGGTGGAGASITATFDVLPGQSYGGSVGGGGQLPTGGSGDGAIGTGGAGGTIVSNHRGGGGGGRTTVSLGGNAVVIAGGGGGGGAAHQVAPAGIGGGGGFTGIAPGAVAVGADGQAGVDSPGTAGGGQGGQAAAGGAGGVNSSDAGLNGSAGGGIGTGTGGNGGPDPGFDSAGGGGGGYTGGGGGASTATDSVSGAGGGGGSSWVSATSPTTTGDAPSDVAGQAGAASPAGAGAGATGSITIDWLPCLYGLTVEKSVSSPTVEAGGSVIWTVSVTNDGPDAMTRGDTLDLTDLLPAGPNGGATPEFEVLTFGVSGGSNAELDRGPVTCTGLSVGNAMPATTTCSRAYGASGAPETPSGGLRGLDPGESLTITYRQVIANTAACATITNTASVEDRATASGSSDEVGVIATQSASASLTIDCYDLAVTKSGAPDPVRAGRDITWTVTVTNNGPADMEGPEDTDPNPLVISDTFPATGGTPALVSSTGPAGTCNLSGSTITCDSGLPDGGQQVLTVTQTVDAGTAPGTTITNTATATDPATGDTDDSSTASVSVGSTGLALVKSADPLSYDGPGDAIAYTYVVTNTGTVALDGPVSVADDRTTATCPPTASLAAGASISCSATYTITQADVDAGSVTNTATASADGVESPADTETVNAAQGPALHLAKTADVATFDTVGDVVGYTYVVTNTGNVTLDGPFSVADDRSTDEACPSTPSLAPGASIACSASYTITQADLDAGSVTNTASATNGDVTSNEDSVTVTAVQSASISLVKTAVQSAFTTAGDVIEYEYVVTNTGNVSLDGPVLVTDDKATVSCPDLVTVGDGDDDLDPGESITCTSSYTVTQADVDAGSVTNVASAAVGGVESVVAAATVDVPAPTATPSPPPTDTALGPSVAGSPVAMLIALLGLLAVAMAAAMAARRGHAASQLGSGRRPRI